MDWVKKSLQAEAEKNRVKKQARLNAERALEEDPTIYQYDEIYSTLHVDPKVKKEEKKKEKPKYITNLLKTAERRKKENELRIERSVQKEREAEGEMFKDKEKFVTASYKAKLQEMKTLEEEEKEMDRLETIGDVTKQGDVSGFYRHLYEQTFDAKKTDVNKEKLSEKQEVKKEPVRDETEKLEENLDKDDSSVHDSSSDEGDDKNKNVAVKILTRIRKVKQSRQRVVEASDSEPEPEPELENKEKGDEEEKENSNSQGETKEVAVKKESEDQKIDDQTGRKRSLSPDVKEFQNGSSKKKKQDEEKPERKKMERRVSIWVKRTVGPVFDAALQRYFARKALRVSGS